MNLDRSFTPQIFRLTLLAPDIIEAVFEGREADGLSFRELIGSIVMLWEEQRRLRGITV